MIRFPLDSLTFDALAQVYGRAAVEAFYIRISIIRS